MTHKNNSLVRLYWVGDNEVLGGEEMKTEQQVIEMKAEILRKIEQYQQMCMKALKEGDKYNFDRLDREYAKYTAQYNILLEVLN